ncbi:MAG: XVIPCD domain-containing protein [Lysobacteraceae bacterium]
MPDGKIVKVVEAKGDKRVYEMDDGTVVERKGGHANWRNNNPGNLKFELPPNAGEETKQKRLTDAQKLYDGIVGLDERGLAIFETPEAGRRAQILLADRKAAKNPDWTLENYVKFYAKDDFGDKAHHDAYLQKVAEIGKANGIDLSKDRTISTLNENEKNVLVDAMKQVEGSKIGDTKLVSWPGMENLKPYTIIVPAGRDMDDASIYAHMCADIAQRNLLPISQPRFDRLVGEMIENMDKKNKPIISPAIPDGALRGRGEFDVDGKKVDGYRMVVTVEMQQDFLSRAKQELKNTPPEQQPRSALQSPDGSERAKDAKANVPAEPLLSDAAHPKNGMYLQAMAAIDGMEKSGKSYSRSEQENMAGALTTAAVASGMNRIDRVMRSTDGKGLIAVDTANPEVPWATRARIEPELAALQTVAQNTSNVDSISKPASQNPAGNERSEQPSFNKMTI